MKQGSSLPALAIVVAAAAVFGVELGESAIAEIDPVHFRGPAIHPAARGAAIDPGELDAPAAPQFASLYGWEEGNAARAEACGDCDSGWAPDPYEQEVEVSYADAVAAAEEIASRERWAEAALDEAEDAIEAIEDEIDWEAVERYAYYPVAEDELEPSESDEDAYPFGGL